ncbi:MAG: Asp23/Gls24 family envelope stress response protein [Lentisphaeria bacterium]|nr:Asp23/Gls24 family envelope stress response protein [Lentisphaeria bacterium]MBR7128552.1 Asp23/Gls24 family envelope stress response protein [Lentisphaeria bacterium]
MKREEEKIEKVQTVDANMDSQGFGDVKIHENVVSSIVRKAALKQAGVARLSGNNFVDTIGEIVGSRRIQDRAIVVKFLDNGSLDLEIKIVVKYGFNLPEVASATQKSIIEEVEKITGINVCKVNVTIQDVEEEIEEEEDSDSDDI